MFNFLLLVVWIGLVHGACIDYGSNCEDCLAGAANGEGCKWCTADVAQNFFGLCTGGTGLSAFLTCDLLPEFMGVKLVSTPSCSNLLDCLDHKFDCAACKADAACAWCPAILNGTVSGIPTELGSAGTCMFGIDDSACKALNGVGVEPQATPCAGSVIDCLTATTCEECGQRFGCGWCEGHRFGGYGNCLPANQANRDMCDSASDKVWEPRPCPAAWMSCVTAVGCENCLTRPGCGYCNAGGLSAPEIPFPIPGLPQLDVYRCFPNSTVQEAQCQATKPGALWRPESCVPTPAPTAPPTPAGPTPVPITEAPSPGVTGAPTTPAPTTAPPSATTPDNQQQQQTPAPGFPLEMIYALIGAGVCLFIVILLVIIWFVMTSRRRRRRSRRTRPQTSSMRRAAGGRELGSRRRSHQVASRGGSRRHTGTAASIPFPTSYQTAPSSDQQYGSMVSVPRPADQPTGYGQMPTAGQAPVATGYGQQPTGGGGVNSYGQQPTGNGMVVEPAYGVGVAPGTEQIYQYPSESGTAQLKRPDYDSITSHLSSTTEKPVYQ